MALKENQEYHLVVPPVYQCQLRPFVPIVVVAAVVDPTVGKVVAVVVAVAVVVVVVVDIDVDPIVWLHQVEAAVDLVVPAGCQEGLVFVVVQHPKLVGMVKWGIGYGTDSSRLANHLENKKICFKWIYKSFSSMQCKYLPYNCGLAL